ncbi:hypothetical protein IEQ34_008123 [Dendrobium chrysotoxum]|uniref:ASCH domain-containing protein n=1 Tax=Dendrobium chrysotoxum TaxID=161865 RepID=A0AAV7H386_DENCH|nr:hypothetical protein IEQ34_008123 [Dendrobium chrysotoxum]
MNGKGSGGSGRGGGRYRNPCLTMHQPWASLLIHGIKRIEGRSWPAPLTGRLWIHAASKVPEPDTIKAMEKFYREIYAVDGVTDIKFPEHYPVSRLLGCVEIVGCLRSEELDGWEEVPQSVRLEAFPGFCWLCEKPQKLIVPFEMRGYQGVYNLENKIYEAAVRGLTAIKSPLPVKFPLPDPQNSLSLKPGSLMSSSSKASEVEKSKSVSAAIAGARAAATQFARKDETRSAIKEQKRETTKNQATPVADIPNRKTYNLRSKGRIQEENQAVNSEEKLMCVIEKTKTRIVVPHGSTKLIFKKKHEKV